MLDLREITLIHKGEIRITRSDSIEFIHRPDGDFFHAVIEDLPNLKEIDTYVTGTTWLDCQNLPNLRKIIIDKGTRWLNVDRASNLSDKQEVRHAAEKSLSLTKS